MRLSLLSAIGSWSGGTALVVVFGDGRRLRMANDAEANTHTLKQRVSNISLIRNETETMEYATSENVINLHRQILASIIIGKCRVFRPDLSQIVPDKVFISRPSLILAIYQLGKIINHCCCTRKHPRSPIS